MTQQLGIVKGDAQQKLGSAGFFIGASLIVIGVLLAPSTGDISNMQELLKKVGEQEVFAHGYELLLALGFLAVMIGTAGVYKSITAGGGAWARVGFYFHIIGTALWTVGYSLDVSVATAAANWLAAPAAGKEAAYGVVAALSATSRGTFPLTIVVNWLAFAFLGIAMVRSTVYPRWLGWVGLIVGMIGVPMGIVMTFTGREVIYNFFAVLMLLTLLWWLMCGAWVARKAW